MAILFMYSQNDYFVIWVLKDALVMVKMAFLVLKIMFWRNDNNLSPTYLLTIQYVSYYTPIVPSNG